MNEKLSLQHLTDLLAQEAQITKKESDFFLRELFQLVLEKIYDNELVKVKDFGTFKLTRINSRESIDVNTGEKIEIPSHFRFVFHPDKILKDLVNLPFSQYETKILEDGVDPSDITFESDDNDSIDINENIVKETISRQVDLMNDFRNKNEAESTSHEDLTKTILDHNTDKQKNQPVSFTYTYATSSTNSNSTNPTNEDDTVTLVIAKDDFVMTLDPKELFEPSDSDQIDLTENKHDDKGLADSEILTADVSGENGESIDASTLDLTHEYIEDNDFDSEIEIIDDNENIEFSELIIDKTTKDESIVETIDSSVLPVENEVVYENQEIETSISKEDIITDNSLISDEHMKEQEDVSEDKISEDDDPQRPLLPLDEKIVESGSVNSKENILNNLSSVENDDNESKLENTQDPEGSNTDINEEADDKSFFYQPKPSVKDKLKKRFPFLLIIVIAIVFAIYSFIKLFNVKYGYERYLGSGNLTLSDTLPLMGDDDMSKAPNSLIVGVSAADSLLNQDSLKTKVNGDSIQNVDVVLQTVEKTKKGVVLDGPNIDGGVDSLSFKIKKNSTRISNILTFDVVNKAQFFVEKNKTSSQQSEIIDVVDKSNLIIKNKDVVTISLGRGMTLRSLAAKYYGNSIYWVYIYEANRSTLPNPNSLTIGMTLEIPNLSQFGIVDPKNREAIKKAQQLEIKYL